jgi:type IV pilus assembly protein PilM
LNVDKVISLLSGQSIVLRPIIMPKMSDKEFKQALEHQASQYLPYQAEEAQIQGVVLRKELEEDPKSMEALLIAAPNEMVKNNQDVIKYANLTPSGIDMEPLAAFRALSICLEPGQLKRTIALINIGASATSINIYKAGMLRTSRTIKVAGNNFTKVISQSLNLSFEEAEKIKKDKGVIRVEKDATPVAPTTMRIFNVIIPVLTELITEVQRSFDFYRSRYSGESVELVVLAGGTARFRNIDAYISNELGVQCLIANPFRTMDISAVQGFSPETLQELAPSLLSAIGALL